MQNAIQQANPGASYQSHRDEIDAAMRQVLDSGRYILGPQVTAFEQEFAAYLGVGYATGVASGTDALHLALRACCVGPGDAVFTVSHTAVATVAAIELCGATPVLVDIDPASSTMDPASLAEAIAQPRAERPAAVIPVHLYGQPAEMQQIRDLATRHGLWVVEDCAQAHGATYGGKRAGALGHLAAFSFYPTKNLGALGDGGMVVTNDAGLASRLCLLREYGWRDRYVSAEAGLNSRLDELQAAILRIKLHYLDQDNRRRRELARRYDELLAEAASVTLPYARPGTGHVYHQYVVRCPERAGLQTYLRDRGIGTAVHYPIPVHLQPAYAGRIAVAGSLACSEAAASQVLSLPMYAELEPGQVEWVAESIRAWSKG